jgi:carbon-monoxide dehydrogenase small subunit
VEIEFTLNGRKVILHTDPLRRLLDVLRDDFLLTGVKEGCGEGECGACAVLVDGGLQNACLIPVGTVHGSDILTIEGYRDTERFQTLAKAFAEEGSVQCGFCTPGFIMAAEALLRKNPRPGEKEIRTAISGNLCRCTGYDMIVRGIERASRGDRGTW